MKTRSTAGSEGCPLVIHREKGRFFFTFYFFLKMCTINEVLTQVLPRVTFVIRGLINPRKCLHKLRPEQREREVTRPSKTEKYRPGRNLHNVSRRVLKSQQPSERNRISVVPTTPCFAVPVK